MHLLEKRSKNFLFSYSSLIFPFFDYGALLMGNLLGYQYDRLQNLKNTTVRYVTDIKFPTGPLDRLQLGWLNVRLRKKYLWGVCIYNTLSYNLPFYLKEKINMYISTTDLRPHPRPHLSVPTSKCFQCNNSSPARMLNFWNTLREYIHLARSLDSFKNNI